MVRYKKEEIRKRSTLLRNKSTYFLIYVIVLAINKNFIGSNMIERCDYWHSLYHYVNVGTLFILSVAYSINLKGYLAAIYSLAPAFLFYWLIAVYNHCGQMSLLDYFEIFLGIPLVLIISNSGKIIRWIKGD